MNWPAIGVLVTIVIALWAGFAAYLNARFDAAINKLSRDIEEDLRQLSKELNGIYLRSELWEQFHQGEFIDLKRRMGTLSEWRHTELPKLIADIYNRIGIR